MAVMYFVGTCYTDCIAKTKLGNSLAQTLQCGTRLKEYVVDAENVDVIFHSSDLFTTLSRGYPTKNRPQRVFRRWEFWGQNFYNTDTHRR